MSVKVIANYPPAVPLVVNDPYMSVWSMADNLTDEDIKHWTGISHPMCGLIRIDGQPYRFMVSNTRFVPVDIPIMEQVALDIHPRIQKILPYLQSMIMGQTEDEIT